MMDSCTLSGVENPKRVWCSNNHHFSSKALMMAGAESVAHALTAANLARSFCCDNPLERLHTSVMKV